MEWRTIPGWPDYEVSDSGGIRRAVPCAGASCRDRKPYLSTNGYLYIVVRRPGSRQAIAIHRLVALAFLGPAPSPQHQVAHRDGNRVNNHQSNLRWCTRGENEADKVAHGRSNRGERQGRSRLTAESVRRIRAMLRHGASQAELAASVGLARTTISSIAIGKSWRWLQ